MMAGVAGMAGRMAAHSGRDGRTLSDWLLEGWLFFGFFDPVFDTVSVFTSTTFPTVVRILTPIIVVVITPILCSFRSNIT